ncbi:MULTISPECIES: GNAT family N-acetyltransferase [unclassified Pseudomonas]|uniref:GNAT family N-acetyltransferase n=1 Tax=unclassified Pseudomonas TaxID=196821 RepID=UPI000CD2FC2F|nr:MULTISPECIES: GNAT family N-acetyltransferase [unclassified Pseudomonas]MBC2658588.1 GNAT family N-acetyltransferase [Pseudomonas sp. MSSRFD41]POA52104.1 GNAT family N-acetyltransferase [Pseudomonas sp. FW507-12TSA]
MLLRILLRDDETSVKSLVHLTPLRPTDVTNLVRLYTDPKVRTYLGGPLSQEAAVKRSILEVDSQREMPLWVIRTREAEQFAGIVSFDLHHDGADIEVSYELLPEYCGKGYATEALSFALLYAKDVMGLKRVIAETQSKNLASIRLLERVGMSLEREVTRFNEPQSIYVSAW